MPLQKQEILVTNFKTTITSEMNSKKGKSLFIETHFNSGGRPISVLVVEQFINGLILDKSSHATIEQAFTAYLNIVI